MLPAFRLAGTPDGLIEWPDRSETVLEVKSHGTAQNYDSGPSEMHVRQAELNIELFHETTAHRPEDAIIIYGLAEDYSRLTLHRVERRPAVFVEMLGKAAAAFDADSAAAVTAEGRRHQAVRHLPLSQPLRRRPGARHSGSRHRRPRPGDAALHRSPRRRPPARRRSRGGGNTRPRRGGSRDHRNTDRCRRQQDQAQRLRRAIEDSDGRPRRPRNPLRLKRRSALGPQVRSPSRAPPHH